MAILGLLGLRLRKTVIQGTLSLEIETRPIDIGRRFPISHKLSTVRNSKTKGGRKP